MKYQRVAKQTYMIIKKASNRAQDKHIWDRFNGATGSQNHPARSTADKGSPMQVPRSTAPVPSTPGLNVTVTTTMQPAAMESDTVKALMNLSAASALIDSVLSRLERADTTIFQSETTGDTAVLLSLHQTDEPTQNIIVQSFLVLARPTYMGPSQKTFVHERKGIG
ncbi:hypothetical protein B0F90DRAFT_635931 [Multifurca ochricompacta]|uniref:Uncharacterized protein n=1 Tax=Multifurca ochricompacta TaxID=376703 RepID=A0AAD4M211_9AGAM|nr:hypothetical protein B0F90DRAFT_635931 [Multifurca ochricompacta]